ncbi:hypothetical protein CLU79DRAFT_846274 [Phycomyces nitens]|nr:hypothetical protein CLU79DRAFT_846274 [Phycomyces nitens]
MQEREIPPLHVVIRLACKRPPGFKEPPSVIWTDEMEHRLWTYMSQKQTDWSLIAGQLGVPTSYVVRQAAFIYETQLRGIHQQLRLGEAKVTPTPTTSSRSTNRRSIGKSIGSSNQSLAPSLLLKKSPIEGDDKRSLGDKEAKRPLGYMDRSVDTLADERELDQKIADQHQSSKSQFETGSPETPAPFRNTGDTDDTDDDDEEEEEEKDGNQQFGQHFENMRRQLEPAFLPARKQSGASFLLPMSKSILVEKPSTSLASTSEKTLAKAPLLLNRQSRILPNLPHTSTTNSPTVSDDLKESESALNSVGSSFSDLSDSVTQSALEDAFLSNFNSSKM